MTAEHRRSEPDALPVRLTSQMSKEVKVQTIDLVEKLAELQRQYQDAHRRVRPAEHYRARHVRRHPKLSAKASRRLPIQAPNPGLRH